jgi:hypothetical protein
MYIFYKLDIVNIVNIENKKRTFCKVLLIVWSG